MELVHALNRGVDGRVIFVDDQDYRRFIHDMYEFNDAEASKKGFRRFGSMDDLRSRPFAKKQLVDVHGWCLMKNHYHLLLSERVDGGLSLFLRKLNVGYAKYFNERHGRIGTLFQGRTRKILISTQAHFLYILHYIHLNPLDYLEGSTGWRVRDKGALQNVRKALDYLESYRWSSYLDYCGKRNFPSILTTDQFAHTDVFENYPRAVSEFLKDIEDNETLGSLRLE